VSNWHPYYAEEPDGSVRQVGVEECLSQTPADRHVAIAKIGPWTVRTVFLAIDYSFGHPSLGPMLYETMVFGIGGEFRERYRSRSEAEAGHEAIVRAIRRRWRRRPWLWLWAPLRRLWWATSRSARP